MVLSCPPVSKSRSSSHRISKTSGTRTTDDNAKVDLGCIDVSTSTTPPLRKKSARRESPPWSGFKEGTYESENNDSALPVAHASVISVLGPNSDSVLIRVTQSDLRSERPRNHTGARHGSGGRRDRRRDCDPDAQRDFDQQDREDKFDRRLRVRQCDTGRVRRGRGVARIQENAGAQSPASGRGDAASGLPTAAGRREWCDYRKRRRADVTDRQRDFGPGNYRQVDRRPADFRPRLYQLAPNSSGGHGGPGQFRALLGSTWLEQRLHFGQRERLAHRVGELPHRRAVGQRSVFLDRQQYSQLRRHSRIQGPERIVFRRVRAGFGSGKRGNQEW